VNVSGFVTTSHESHTAFLTAADRRSPRWGQAGEFFAAIQVRIPTCGHVKKLPSDAFWFILGLLEFVRLLRAAIHF
jgi:hypothetical protein